MRKELEALLRQPLLHFALLGSALFCAYHLMHRLEVPKKPLIIVTDGQVMQLVDGFRRLRQRAPAATEIHELIEQDVRTRIMAKQAVALGLDSDDAVIQRRLTQKLDFLLESMSEAQLPNDADLRLYLSEHAARYRKESQLAFEHVFFNRDRRALGSDAAAQVRLARLRYRSAKDWAEAGDPFLLGNEFPLTPRDEVLRLFGSSFAQALDDLPLNRWSGPIQSAFGTHLVLVRERVAERLPSLGEIRSAVMRDWLAERARAFNDATYRTLRTQYTVVVQPSRSNNK